LRVIVSNAELGRSRSAAAVREGRKCRGKGYVWKPTIAKPSIDNEAAIDVKDNKGLTALRYGETECSAGAVASGAERRRLGV
jgi:hypothetical protein